MRRINKGTPIAAFWAFLRSNPTNWSDFSHPNSEYYPNYLASKEQILITEQNCFCGYTELAISEVSGVHLDHYRKKSLFPAEKFNWNNLIAATYDTDFGACYKDSTYRIKEEEYALIFNPVEDDVQNYFYYNTNGEIEPNPTEKDANIIAKVHKTVEVFKLNHQTLSHRRAILIQSIEDCKAGELDNETIKSVLSNSDFLSVIEQYTQD